MSKQVRLKGATEVLRTLQKISTRTENTTPEAIERAAFEIEKEAALTVRVDTGRLKGSIQTIKQDDTHFEVSAGGMEIDGKEVDYAAVIEFGGKNQAAYPFMRPAADKARAKYADTVISGVKKAIKQAGVR